MGLIICPECKKQVSDRCKACIHCGFPFDLLDKEASPEEDAPASEEIPSPMDPEKSSPVIKDDREDRGIEQKKDDLHQMGVTPPTPVSEEKPKKKKKKILPVLLIILLILAVAGGGCYYYFMVMDHGITVKEVTAGQWTKDYDREYSMNITSDQKKPFVVLIEMKSGEDVFEKYVFMEDGQGQITNLRTNASKEDKAPEYTARPVGYYEGEVTPDGFLKDINTKYNTGNFLDELKYYSLKKMVDYTDVYKKAEFTISTHENETGILIYDVSTNLNKSVDKNRAMAIVNGRGRSSITYSLKEDDVDKKFEAKFIPRFFIKAESVSAADYEVLTNMTVEGKETAANSDGEKYLDYTGTEKLSLKNTDTGMLLYKATRTGGKPVVRSNYFDDDYTEWWNYSQAKNKIVNISLSQNFDILSKEPQFNIEVAGIISYKQFENAAQGLQEGKTTDILSNLMTNSDKNIKDDDDYFRNALINVGESPDGEYISIASDGSYMSIDTNPTDIDKWYDEDTLEAIKKINIELGFGESLYKLMSKTRAIDGTRTEENDNIKVSWTYHPDSGLEVTYTKK